MTELNRKRKRSIEIHPSNADFRDAEAERRQSYPFRRNSGLTKKPKRVLNKISDSQKSNGRRSYPIFDSQAYIARRKRISNDDSDHQGLNRRKSSLVKRDEHEKKPEPDESVQLRDNEVKCFICAGVFIKKELAKHIKETHNDFWEEGSTVRQMEKRYCPLCKDSIRRLHEQGKGAPKNLKSHIRIAHAEKYNKDAEAKDMLFPERKRITKWEDCPLCGLRYTADQLERHMQIKHQ
ncbi:hypothetical protein GE09DRAFT_1225654 [Coniochaeta sp. 2T2.1]|nr:hypothetical protein GE09DRAFT_1225654 [Coniochaeta sp. 2T2.1]